MTKDNMLIIKNFVSSSQPISDLRNQHFKNLCKVKIPDAYTFRYTTLPSIMEILYDALEIKLQNASYVCIIIDIWTNLMNADFIGLGAVIVYIFLLLFDKNYFSF